MQNWPLFFIIITGSFSLLRIVLLFLQEKSRVFHPPKSLIPYYDVADYKAIQQQEHIKNSFDIFKIIVLKAIIIFAIYFGWFGKFYDHLGNFLAAGTMQDTGFLLIVGSTLAIFMGVLDLFKIIFFKSAKTDSNKPKKILKRFIGVSMVCLLLGIPVYIFFFIVYQYPGYIWILLALLAIVFRKLFRRIVGLTIQKSFFLAKDKPLLMYIQKTAKPIRIYLQSNSEKLEKICQFVENQQGLSINQIHAFTSSNESNPVTAYCFKDTVYLDDRLLGDDFDEEEFFAILAHEIAHIDEPIYFSRWSVIILFIAFVVGFHYSAYYEPWSLALGAKANAPVLNLIAFNWFFSILNTFLKISGKYHSRLNEYRADYLAVQHTSKEAVSNLLKKTYGQDLAPIQVHSWYEFAYETHPSLTRRLNFVQSIPQNTAEDLIHSLNFDRR